MGTLKADSGDFDEAMTWYYQSLDFSEQAGDIQGMASTFHRMAMLKTAQGDVEKAILFHELALEIYQRIEHLHGKAATLLMLGQLLGYSRKDVCRGVAYIEESQEILQQLKSPDAETAQGIITQVRQVIEQ
jgi:tetratricopeptide (TPR) repeat protein